MYEDFTNNILSNDSESSDETPFYFESDHLALKGNADYLTLIKSLTHLQGLKAQTIQDIDHLLSEQRRAVKNPDAFLVKLKSGETKLSSGQRIKVPEVPNIDWSKYELGVEVTKRPLKRTFKSTETDYVEAGLIHLYRLQVKPINVMILMDERLT